MQDDAGLLVAILLYEPSRGLGKKKKKEMPTRRITPGIFQKGRGKRFIGGQNYKRATRSCRGLALVGKVALNERTPVSKPLRE